MGRDGEYRRTGFVFPLSTRINSQHQKDTAGSIFLPPAVSFLLSFYYTICFILCSRNADNPQIVFLQHLAALYFLAGQDIFFSVEDCRKRNLLIFEVDDKVQILAVCLAFCDLECCCFSNHRLDGCAVCCHSKNFCKAALRKVGSARNIKK